MNRSWQLAQRPLQAYRTREVRWIHRTGFRQATPFPLTAHGPPPEAPVPAAVSRSHERSERRQQRSALLRSKEDGPLPKRFWKEVSVKEVPEGFQVLLDTRPVRTPSKAALTIPPSKPQLAAAIALEWELLSTAQQALKQHYIPLTSLAARADGLREQEQKGETKTRQEIIEMAMRYLDTDTLLCWAPKRSDEANIATDSSADSQEGLRALQIKTAAPIISFLSAIVWPGAEIHPVGESNSIVPASQPQMTKDIIRGWLSGLPPYELAGLERAVLAGKGLLGAVRLIVEWSPVFRGLRFEDDEGGSSKFGVEEATEAASIEVRWQTGMWGEVEDTHDVEREDLRRQLGSVVLLVSGEET